MGEYMMRKKKSSTLAMKKLSVLVEQGEGKSEFLSIPASPSGEAYWN